MALPPGAGTLTGPLGDRRAGVLAHLTSLPSRFRPSGDLPFGTGDVGPAAHRFLDFLAAAGCTVWQVLPLVPTHPVDRSPYNGVSSLAGNPELISLEVLVSDGLLSPETLSRVLDGELTVARARDSVVSRWGEVLGADPDLAEDFTRFVADRGDWLEPFVEFVALREQQGCAWASWPAGLRDREPDALAAALAPLTDRLTALRAEQYLFDRQWAALRLAAQERGVLLFGDLPIFVSYDSADVWASREMFLLDPEGRPTTVTGVPPDYFSEEGQRWNNPHYDWDRMAQDDYAWWRRRVGRQRELFDLIRIDHFRGFQAAWHVPVEAPSAKTGHWVQSPGPQVLEALIDTSGPGTLVAEDLGIITAEVDALRARFGLPGMKVLQFAFDGDPDNFYLPENHGTDAVVYTGTHDNDTTAGWWSTTDAATRARVRAAVPHRRTPMPWALVELAMASTAQLAVVPLQDLLGLGSESRMNTPGTPTGNWAWQVEAGAVDDVLARRLRSVVEEAGRIPTLSQEPLINPRGR